MAVLRSEGILNKAKSHSSKSCCSCSVGAAVSLVSRWQGGACGRCMHGSTGLMASNSAAIADRSANTKSADGDGGLVDGDGDYSLVVVALGAALAAGSMVR